MGATGKEESVNEIYTILSRLTKFDKPPVYTDPRKGEVRRISLDPTKAKEKLNWQAQLPLLQGLRKTVDFINNLS